MYSEQQNCFLWMHLILISLLRLMHFRLFWCLIMRCFSEMQRSQFFWPGWQILHFLSIDHLTSGSVMRPSLHKFSFLSHTYLDKAVSFLLYSALNECLCRLIRLLTSVFVMPTQTAPFTSALYTTAISLHSPGNGQSSLQLHFSFDFFSLLLVRTFLLWAEMISFTFCVVEYDNFSVWRFSATVRSWLAGKCLSMRDKNCFPMLVARHLLNGGFQ